MARANCCVPGITASPEPALDLLWPDHPTFNEAAIHVGPNNNLLLLGMYYLAVHRFAYLVADEDVPSLLAWLETTLHRYGNTDVKITTLVGPLFATTRCTTEQRGHHPDGANIGEEPRPSRGHFR